MEKSLLRTNVITIFAHISGWCVFLFVPFLIRRTIGIQDPIPIKDFPDSGIFVFFLLLFCLFYVNYSVSVPRVLNRYGVRHYGLAIFVMLIFTLILAYFIKNSFLHDRDNTPIFMVIFPFTVIMAMSLSIRLLMDRTKSERDMKERENETLKSELSFLRSQISPHFLFNVMNNVVSLSRLKPHLVEPTLIQLSQLMRYMLYGSDEKKVTIQNEISYLQSYIDLQNLRFGDTVSVFFEKTLPTALGTEGVLEPMLLIPFVENAYKHGIGLVRNPEIHIQIWVENGVLFFEVRNKFEPSEQSTKDETSGIGLKNVSRRLELLYTNQHDLTIKQEGEWFEVHLKINLNKN
jgi:two-component system, LytTR family, sensor kinase